MADKSEFEYNFPPKSMTSQKLSYTKWGRDMYRLKNHRRAAGENVDHIKINKEEYEAYMKHRGKVYKTLPKRGK